MSGLQIENTHAVEGNPQRSANGDTISIHYTGRFQSNQVFDSSHKRGTPLTFTLGQGRVIQGYVLHYLPLTFVFCFPPLSDASSVANWGFSCWMISDGNKACSIWLLVRRGSWLSHPSWRMENEEWARSQEIRRWFSRQRWCVLPKSRFGIDGMGLYTFASKTKDKRRNYI